MTKLPLAVRLDIRDNYDNQKDQLLQRLSVATGGIPFDFVVDFNAVHSRLGPEHDSASKIGTLVGWYLQGITNSLSDKLKDDMVREEFIEVLPERKIIFEIVDELHDSYFDLVVEGGSLYIRTTKAAAGTNAHVVGQEIVAVLSRV